MIVREARRACGALGARAEGDPVRLSICHCLAYEIERRPGMIPVPAGAFADPTFPPPTIEVYEERRCPWLPDFGIPREF